jgi:hypothetical protein
MDIFKSIAFSNDDGDCVEFGNVIDSGEDRIEMVYEEKAIISFSYDDFKKLAEECVNFFKFLE